MSFIDFAELKARVSIEDAVAYLNIEMKERNGQLRSSCPHCGGADRTLVVTPSKQAFYCWNSKKGGDCISLVAHALDIPVKEAAAKLWERYCTSTVPSTSTVPEERRSEETQKLQPLSYLEPEHDAVVAVGFDTRIAEELGIGYAGKGLMRGLVAIPIRDDRGKLRGYIGIEEAKLPKDFQPPENVVAFPKRA